MNAWRIFRVSAGRRGTNRQAADGASLIQLRHGGKSGWGELAPLAGYSTETPTEALRMLIHFLEQNTAMASWSDALPELAIGSPAAAFALEGALGELGLLPVAGGEVPVAMLWRGEPLPDGLRFVKLKYHGSKSEMTERLRRLRGEFGFSGTIRLDTNGRWRWAEDALQALSGLKALGVTEIEQPLAQGPDEEWAELIRQLPMRFSVDEGLHRTPLGDWLASGLSVGYVLKGMHSGDLGTLRKQVEQIEAHNLPWNLGSLLPGPVGRRHEYRQAAALATLRWGSGPVGACEQGDDGLRWHAGTVGVSSPLQVRTDDLEELREYHA